MPSFETYSDENIVQSILQEKQADIEQEDDDNNGDSIQNNTINSKEAKDSLQKLIKFFIANNENCSEHINS